MTTTNHLTGEQLHWVARQRIAGRTDVDIAFELNIPRESMRFAYADPIESPHEVELYDNADCVGEDPQLFEYDQEARPGLNLYEWESRMWRAASVCVTCPVMVLCGRLATADERTWTMRGGLMPYQFTLDQSKFSGMTVLH